MAHIKECFRSRFGSEGVIVEADFSQLEVIGAAIVSNDPMMKQDILDGIDSHCQSAAWLNPKYSYEEIRQGYLEEDAYFSKLRKNAKAPRFELQYGAGAKSIAANNGLTVEQAQGFIDRYYERYAILKKFQEHVMDCVKRSIKPSERRSPSGLPLGVGKWKSSTGRIYTFYEQEAPKFMQDKGTLTSISPTQIANYPMQGFSTGDIVPEVLGRLHRALSEDDELYDFFLPINTIHDSIIFDVHTSVLTRGSRIVKETMEKAPQWMWERFGIDIDLPLGVDLEYGVTWEHLTKLEIEE